MSDRSQLDLVEERLAALLSDYDPARGADAEFRGRQFDLGLAWAHHTEGDGGLGVAPEHQQLVDARLLEAGVPADVWRAGIGLLYVVPTLMAFGSPDQRSRFLRPMFIGEEVWCQLFSEPGAGSDLAGLATRAVRREDGWIVNGQKVWSSLAHAADRGILCARTDPDQPKHKGLTYFLLDMSSEGVEPRPLRQLTGDAEFDEVYFTDVTVPDTDRVGEVGQGWEVILATLASERTWFTTLEPSRGGGPIAFLLGAWDEHGDRMPHLRDQVVALAARAEVLRLTVAGAFAGDAAAQAAASSYVKLAASELENEILDLTITLMGPAGLTYEGYEMYVPDTLEGSLAITDPRRMFLSARGRMIAGGTSEIQRNIIADRVLGLPREPQQDRNIPWREIPRA